MNYLELIENKLKTYFPQGKEKDSLIEKVLIDSMEYSLEAGGKRIRPTLTLIFSEVCGGTIEQALPFACGIEMIHTYSLIHDDLPCMDDDDLRRGKPTNHKVYGEDIAVLAGDTLLNEAMNLMMKFSLKHGKEALMAAQKIAEASGPEGMIGGQVVDIINEGKKISEEELKYMHMKKTGALINVSIISGAILANAPKEDINLLEKFGEKLGLAFQIKDDILSEEGDPEVTGKPVGNDKEMGKCTYVSYYGLDGAKKELDKITENAIQQLNDYGEKSEFLKQLASYIKNRNK